MLRTIGSRMFLLVPTLFGLSVLLFIWVRALPGGPAVALLGERATPEAIEEINELYGFNEPLIVQYFTWLGRLLQGDFGVIDPDGRPVVEEFARRFPATLELSIVALILAVGIGIPLGYLGRAPARQGVRPPRPSSASLLGITIPVFFLAFILKYIFAVQLGWLPVGRPPGPAHRRDALHELLRARRASSRASGMPRGTRSCT